MSFQISHDCGTIDWNFIATTLQRVGMAHFSPDIHRKAFEASHTTVFIHDEGQLIGFGRAISDGAYQAAIYDCAVLPEYQGQGVGALIMKEILRSVDGCNVILYAAPGKEAFYRKQGFSMMKTGMAKFTKDRTMREKGFIE